MIKLTLWLRRPGGGAETTELALAPEYGTDPATAHEMVTYCLVDATHPVLIDADGDLWRIGRKRLLGYAVWEDLASGEV